MQKKITKDKEDEVLNRLFYLMRKNKISQIELAHKLGFKTGNAIMYWKNGKSKSYMKYIQQISEIFNVSANYLLGMEIENDSMLEPVSIDIIDQAIDEFLLEAKINPENIDINKKMEIRKYLIKQLEIYHKFKF